MIRTPTESSFISSSHKFNETEISARAPHENSVKSVSRLNINIEYSCTDKFKSGLKWIFDPIQQHCSSERETYSTWKSRFNPECLKSEVNRVNGLLKYFTFGIMFTNGLLGLTLFFIGLWSSFEHRTISHIPTTNVKEMTSFNPFNMIGITLCIFGLLFFILCLISCVGINRENLNFLRISLIGQVLTLICFFVFSIIILIWSEKLRPKIAQVMMIGLKQYYHIDKAWTIFFDKLHLNYFCCGVYSFNDWNGNPNYACKSSNMLQNSDACSVPFTCCKTEQNENVPTNRMKSLTYTCGMNVLPSENMTINMDEIQERININGCFDEILPIIQQLIITAGIFMFLICIIICVTLFLTCLLTFEIRMTLSNVKRHCQTNKHSTSEENHSEREEQMF